MTPKTAQAPKPPVPITGTITLEGEDRTLTYGLLAWDALGVIPWNPESMADFKARGTRLSIGTVAALISAGLLQEYYGKDAPRKGQVPPTPEDIMADCNPLEFTDLMLRIFKLLREEADSITPTTENGENPTKA